MNAETFPQPTQPPWQDRWASGLFWSWNIIFMAFMVLGFGPRLIPELMTAVRTEAISWQVLVYALALTLIPAAALVLGWTLLKGQPRRLFTLGYVVEGPLMLMLAVRFFAVRQASNGLTFLLITAGLGMAACLWYLLDTKPKIRHLALASLQLAGLSLMVLVSLYAAVWISFYALPGISYLFRMVRFTFGDLSQVFQNLIWLPFILLGYILLLFTSSLLIMAPIAVPYLSIAMWWNTCKAIIRRRFSWAAIGISALVSTAAVILFVLANRQPQQEVFALLKSPPTSPAEARQILEKSEAIRAGLLNAYLGPFRYISSVGEVNHIKEMYIDVYKVTPRTAQRIQDAYELVARPLLYTPFEPDETAAAEPNQPRFAMQRDPARAARLYQRVFDDTIVDGERQTVLAAARSTWSITQAESALQTLDERQVHLERQEITVHENGDWAEIELYEVYRNMTSDRQEVIYFFSLPESAVITGIWLGETSDREDRHAFHVAPRGAAQAVYRNEVRRNIDPALVEQIGPRQYRLRIFPVPPVNIEYDEKTARTKIGDAPPMHFWMTWKTLSVEQRWPMPRLTMKRNVFWNDDTVRIVNNSPTRTVTEEAWMPSLVEPSRPILLEAHQFDFPGGYSVTCEPAGRADLPGIPAGLNLAVVIDRSRSMEKISMEVNQAVAALQNLGAARTDLYLTASTYRGEKPVRISLSELPGPQLEFLGGQNPAQLLAQFAEMRGDQDYDAVIVLTDGSGYELGTSTYEIPAFKMPVWMVHLGNQIPIGYDDKTLEAIQGSQGGIAGSLNEALQRISAGIVGKDTASSLVLRDIFDGYIWTVHLDGVSGGHPPLTDGFNSIAARRVILAEMQRLRGRLDDPKILDQLHGIATTHGIVTPYSSMIVLVNSQQESLLKGLSEKDDRYKREVEELGDTSPATQAPLIGVPEPEEWLLIGASLVLLSYVVLTRRMQKAAAVR